MNTTNNILQEYTSWFEVSLQAATSREDLDKRINGIIACLKSEIAEGKINELQRGALLAYFRGFCNRNRLIMSDYTGVVQNKRVDIQKLMQVYLQKKQASLPSPYRTQLGMADQMQYQGWRGANQVPDENTGYSSEYDMPGFYKEQQSGGTAQRILNGLSFDGPTAMKSDGLHYPDTYKTPFHKSFSNESKYKYEGLNREWKQNNTGGWDLIDLNNGAIVQTDNG